MNRDTIRRQLSGKGPFIVRTSDGASYRVPHSEFAWMARHYLVLENDAGAFDIIDPLHVVSIRPEVKRKAARSEH